MSSPTKQQENERKLRFERRALQKQQREEINESISSASLDSVHEDMSNLNRDITGKSEGLPCVPPPHPTGTCAT